MYIVSQFVKCYLLLALKPQKLTGILSAVYDVCVNDLNPELAWAVLAAELSQIPKGCFGFDFTHNESGSPHTLQLPPRHGSFHLQITRTDQASSTSLCKITLPSHQRTESSLQPSPKWKLNSREGVWLGWHSFSRTIMERKRICLALSKIISYHVLKCMFLGALCCIKGFTYQVQCSAEACSHLRPITATKLIRSF